MPNTLAHLGTEAALIRLGWRRADLKWIYLGCVIPDLPWILQRAVRLLPGQVDPYGLLLYSSVQASLLFGLVLSGALAACAVRFRRAFGLLSLAVLLHLLLDACQTKWANGVHLFAPFSWRLTNFALFWPEHGLSYALTLFGLVYVAAYLRQSCRAPLGLTHRRWPLALGLLAAYLLLPLICGEGARRADNYYVRTLQETTARTGRPIAFDRARYFAAPETPAVRSFAGERLAVTGLKLDGPAIVSLRGRFLSRDRIAVEAFHVHRSGLRDLSSYLGLGLVGLVWLGAVVAGRAKERGELGNRVARQDIGHKP